jgi:hypothetical protein
MGTRMSWASIQAVLVANQVQIFAVSRYVLTLLCGFAAGHGFASSDTVTLISSIALAVGPLVWSILAHTQSAQINAVAAMPEVKNITTTKALADAAPSEKVTNGFVAPPKAP